MTNPKPTTQLDQALVSAEGEPYFLGAAYGPEDAEAHAALMARLRGMSREQFLASLVAAGIYAPDGSLLPPYASDDDAPEGTAPVTPRVASR